jgi:phospholipid transport system transporter-binding protein
MIVKEGKGFRVDGPITMHTVRSVMEEGQSLFNHDVLEIDLSGVKEADSSAVSLLLEWVREAQRRNQQLRYLNLPENIKSLANLYGVLELIPQGQ